MNDRESLLAVIPARGGSKRVPRKNIRLFFGHPILAYTITAALNSDAFERVVVSTDDVLTGRIAEWYGATFLPRPKELAVDEAGLVDVGIHVLETLERQGHDFDALCQLMPNCPLRTSEDIVDQLSLFQREGRLFQISVVPYRGVYPHWALVSDEEGHGRWLFGSEYVVRSQELERTYCPTGAIWWVRAADFRAQQAFYGNPFHMAPMDATRGIDIDNLEEFELAEILVEGFHQRYGQRPLEQVPVDPFPLEDAYAR